MKKIFTLIYLLTLLTNNSCSNNKWVENLNDFEVIKIKNTDFNIHVIPNTGCSGCISGQEEFAKKNINSEYDIFVFTKIVSLKMFKNKFPEFYNAKNIIIDSTNVFRFIEDENEIYPIQFKKKNGQIKFIQYFKPQ